MYDADDTDNKDEDEDEYDDNRYNDLESQEEHGKDTQTKRKKEIGATRTNHREHGANNSMNDDDDTNQGNEEEETNEWKSHTYNNMDIIDYKCPFVRHTQYLPTLFATVRFLTGSSGGLFFCAHRRHDRAH